MKYAIQVLYEKRAYLKYQLKNECLTQGMINDNIDRQQQITDAIYVLETKEKNFDNFKEKED